MADDDTKPMAAEVAPARLDDQYIGLWAKGIREANDPILRGRGGDLKFYDHVRSDPQVASTLQQRMAAVASRRWQVDPGAPDATSEEAAARLQEELTALNFSAKLQMMHWCVFYGYSVAEIMWAAEGGRVTFGDIRVRRARRFGFTVDGQLMLRPTLGASEQPMPDRKFWLATVPSDTDDEPYGSGLGHLLYWPAYFRRNSTKSWLLALRRFAAPTPRGQFPPGTPVDDQAKLMQALLALEEGGALIHPDGIAVDLMQASKSAGLDYEAFDRRMDAWIAKVVLSQTMTTDDGSSNSQSSTHMEVREEVAQSDADLIAGSFGDGPSQWWTEWNFGDRATPPIINRVMETEEDQDAAAARDTKLYAMGWEPSEARIADTYGDGYQRRALPATPPATTDDTPPQLADADGPDAIGAFVDRLMADGTAAAAATDIVAPIAEALDSATSLADLAAQLEAMAGDDGQIERMRTHLAEAMFAARIGGEVGAGLRDGVEVETP